MFFLHISKWIFGGRSAAGLLTLTAGAGSGHADGKAALKDIQGMLAVTPGKGEHKQQERNCYEV